MESCQSEGDESYSSTHVDVWQVPAHFNRFGIGIVIAPFDVLPRRIRRPGIPFPQPERPVSGRLEHQGNGLHLFRNNPAAARPTRITGFHVARDNTVPVPAGQNGGTQPTATSGVIKLRQPHTVCRQRVKVRSE